MSAAERELLWPEGAPFAKGSGPDHEPAITVYPVADDRTTGTAVVICPGGGYGNLSMGHEGHDIAEWLNRHGVTGIVLEYRMSRGGYRHPVPLGDAQRAIRTVRARAASLGINPERIGILGFSAGGHLAASTGVFFDAGDPDSADPVERVSSRPDFMVLCYPVIAFGEAFTHQGSQRNLIGADASPQQVRLLSLEKQVTADTPAGFLFHTNADKAVPPENSIVFYNALRQSGIPAELHIYELGHHGVGMAPGIPGTSGWPDACIEWMRNKGWLEREPK
jgi:acetyl esterase/lipase